MQKYSFSDVGVEENVSTGIATILVESRTGRQIYFRAYLYTFSFSPSGHFDDYMYFKVTSSNPPPWIRPFIGENEIVIVGGANNLLSVQDVIKAEKTIKGIKTFALNYSFNQFYSKNVQETIKIFGTFFCFIKKNKVNNILLHRTLLLYMFLH